MERRGGGLVRNEGEAECLRVVVAEGATLTAHKIGDTDGAELEEFERSEHLRNVRSTVLTAEVSNLRG